jgi:tRNA(adenine34) deaminase
MISVFSDEYFMKMALKEAEIASQNGEIPVGAVIVCQNQILARTHNMTELLNDVTAHAEILALTAASQALGAKYLNECTIYVSLEPCIMCAGALAWAQIGRIVYAAYDEKKGYNKLASTCLHPKTEVLSGILEQESKKMIQDFFKDKR